MASQTRDVFGTFEKRAPGLFQCPQKTVASLVKRLRFFKGPSLLTVILYKVNESIPV